MGRKVVAGDFGKIHRMFLAGNEFCVEDSDIQETANEEDVTNSCGAGFAEQEFGIGRLEGTLNATWDVSANAFNDPPALRVGAKFAGSRLYVNSTGGVGLEDGPYFLLTLQIASGLRVAFPVRGKVALTIPFVSFNSYTLPQSEISASS